MANYTLQLAKNHDLLNEVKDTLNDIKKDKDWESAVDNILIEEIHSIKIGDSLGSWRGYATFVESKLYENTVKAVLFKIGKLEKCI